MRDPKRIKAMLELIEKIWTKHPDLRLCQLLENVSTSIDTSMYYMEDDELERRLKTFYE